MTQTSTRSWGKRLLAMAMALAMLLAYIPANVAPHAHAVTLTPEAEKLEANRVVYVKAGGMSFDKATLDASSEEVLNATGSLEYPIGSVELAMAFLSYRAADQDAVIVVMGEVESTLSYNANESNCPLGSYEIHTGTYYITGVYGDYTDGGTINFTKGSNSNYCFGGNVVIENIAINRTKDKWQNLHSVSSLIIGEGVTCDGFTAKLALLCGSYHASGDLYSATSYVEVNSGTWGIIRGCSNTASMTSTEIVVNGGTIDTVAAGNNTNAQTVDTVTITVNGGTVNQLNYTGTGKAAPITKDVVFNLNGGTVTEISKAAGTIEADGSVTVNVASTFDINSITTININTTLGAEFNSTLNIAAGAVQPSETIAAEFTTVGCSHVYDNDCDAECNLCGATREVEGHANGNADHECDICGTTLSECHYDNACDAECDLCGATREVGDHVSNTYACADGICTECGAAIPAADHSFENGKCECGLVIVYCINSNSWSKVNAYVWPASGSQLVTWPGASMTKTDVYCNGYSVYSYTFNEKYVNIIFNNDSGSQTADLTVQAGQYYDLSSNTWYASLSEVPEVTYYLRGSMNGWGTETPMTSNGDGTYSVTLTLDAGTYEYKAAVADWSWSCPSGSNATMTLDKKSNVTFTLDLATNSVTWTVAAEYKLGDADGDGYVDAYDASLIKKYSVGAITADDLNLAVLDLDNDGYVDAYDASLIQKYSVGAIDKFPVEE